MMSEVLEEFRYIILSIRIMLGIGGKPIKVENADTVCITPYLLTDDQTNKAVSALLCELVSKMRYRIWAGR